MIDLALEAGADAVKFQTFRAESVMTKSAPKADYQNTTTKSGESQLEMVKKLELSKDEHRQLRAYCKEKNLMFLSTPFDLESIDFLKELGIEIFKIPSGEITDYPYLKKIGGLKKKIILSTGMADLDEIREALDLLIQEGIPKKDITVLHCHTEYPTRMEDVNLLSIKTKPDS